MDPESGSRSPGSRSWKAYRTTLLLAYQSFGVVYGDLSISPIYVYKSTFSGKLRLHEEEAEVLGVLSLVFWTLTLIPLCKYIIFVLGADDNGEGGTFALYSLMCRKTKMGLLATPQAANEHLSAYKLETSSKETRTSLLVKNFFEKHRTSRIALLLFVLLGTSMVIGDGVLTPAMSVLSAVSGLKIKIPRLHENCIVFVSCIVLVGLFALQHYGTQRVSFLFAPILIAWLGCISGIGIYNIFKWNPGVVRALSPYYVYNFFKKAGKDGWSSLGGVVLCITGAEAMFADLGHFSKLSIRVAFTAVVYPCLVVAYMGEAAYLSKHREDLHSSFYKALPESIFWPVLVIATLATVVGSQAIISATFSIISQCRALGCFPRVKIIHTSSHVHGQIYIPEVNWLLMLLCLAVTIGFRDIDMIGNAYGLAVIIVMFVTTCLMFLIITTVWKRSIFLVLLFVVTFGSLELLYFSACLVKVPHGGWFPLIFSLIILLVMSAWHYGTAKKQAFELQNKVCLDYLLSISPSLGLVRVPGVGLVYSNIMTGVPPMFAHFVTNFPAFHRILIFVCLRTLTVPKVPVDERFLIGRIGPPEYRLFRCIVRYGYKDGGRDSYEFENQLLMKVAEYLQQEVGDSLVNGEMSVVGQPSNLVVDAVMGSERTERSKKRVRFKEAVGADVRQEVRELADEREAGVSYMMGHTCVVAHESSSFIKKFVIDVVYGFLRRNSRRPAVALGIPHASLIEVGMVYHV
ncbi:probable potassium transporter 13 isoform X1 [Phoenix dactylifera]|uniref:Potassium transporter n=2 Tax=Phoenix dactylifera TaxID=42345 RepID=A0A8B8JCZ5_PHODC|nr:probable potassium transporter 13 isoform X1 [Phoenix dactylifera]